MCIFLWDLNHACCELVARHAPGVILLVGGIVVLLHPGLFALDGHLRPAALRASFVVSESSVFPCVCLSVYLVGLLVYMSVFFCLSVCVPACLSACLSVFLSVCLSAGLSIFPFRRSVCRSAFPSV